DWLADAIARADQKRKSLNAEDAEKSSPNGEGAEKKKSKSPRQGARLVAHSRTSSKDAAPKIAATKSASKKVSANSASSAVKALAGADERAMPAVIHPMLATPADKGFDDPDWLFEIKWDGYRAVAFIEDGRVRLVSRSQPDAAAYGIPAWQTAVASARRCAGYLLCVRFDLCRWLRPAAGRARVSQAVA